MSSTTVAVTAKASALAAEGQERYMMVNDGSARWAFFFVCVCVC